MKTNRIRVDFVVTIPITILLLMVSAGFSMGASNKFNLDVPFKSIDFYGLTDIVITFQQAVLNEEYINVTADLDDVSVVLKKGAKKEKEVYTTLNLQGATRKNTGLWYEVEKAVIVVRHKDDLKKWQTYLNNLKKKEARELMRKYQPTRVLPPDVVPGY